MRKIISHHSRLNCYASIYADIAMENYCKARQTYELIKKHNYCGEAFELEMELFKCSSIVCVFSTMAIESFFNDYAATCLGDEDFYENFDRLSTMSKFQLISTFILEHEIDKSQEYYSNLKTMIKVRDKLVHNKSKVFRGYNEEEIKEIHKLHKSENVDFEKITAIDREDVRAEMELARTSIKAMRDISNYFDNLDEHAKAAFKILHKNAFSEYQPEYRKSVHEEFSI